MSYYGIRKMKYKQTQAGMWTVACEYYDSSIWGYDDKRVWNTTEEFVKPFNTKEELMKTYCNNPKYSNVQVIALEK